MNHASPTAGTMPYRSNGEVPMRVIVGLPDMPATPCSSLQVQQCSAAPHYVAAISHLSVSTGWLEAAMWVWNLDISRPRSNVPTACTMPTRIGSLAPQRDTPGRPSLVRKDGLQPTGAVAANPELVSTSRRQCAGLPALAAWERPISPGRGVYSGCNGIRGLVLAGLVSVEKTGRAPQEPCSQSLRT